MTDTSPEIAGAAGQVPVAPAVGRAGRPEPRAEPRGRADASLRRVLFPVALAALVVAVIVAVAGAVVSQRIAESEAVHDVAELTDDLADSVVQPALTNTMPRDPAEARRVLDPLVRHWLRNGSMVRVKIWTPAGMVLYSDEPRLIGETFALEPGARSALLSPRTDADVSDLRLPENRFERSDGKLLEVYRPVWTPDGQPLLFETYFRYDMVSQRSHQLWRAFAGVMLSSLLALVILLAGVGWLLLVRSRRARAEREQLLEPRPGRLRRGAAADRGHAARRRGAATGCGVLHRRPGRRSALPRTAMTAARKASSRWPPPSATAWPACVRCWSTSTRPACATPGCPARCTTWSAARPGTTPRSSRRSTPRWPSAVPEQQQEMMFRIAQEAPGTT